MQGHGFMELTCPASRVSENGCRKRAMFFRFPVPAVSLTSATPRRDHHPGSETRGEAAPGAIFARGGVFGLHDE